MSRVSRFLNLWRGRSLDNEFEDELTFHLAMRTAANIRAGMSPQDAEREARRHLGAAWRAKEGMREARVMTGIDSFAQDVRYGVRMFWRQPGAIVCAVLMLSLGIGANAVVFSLLHAVLLRPLPFANPDRLVAIVDNFQADRQSNVPPTVPELLDVRAASRHLERLSFFDLRDVQINGGTEPARAFSARVDSTFLATLGVQPALGRLFGPAEDAPGGDRAVILTDAFWRSNFGSDPQIVGRQIIVNGVPSAVVGVLPPEFSFDYVTAEPIELYVPYPMTAAYTSRAAEFTSVRRVTAIGRVAAGVSIEQASAEVAVVSHAIAAEHPPLYRRGSDGREFGFVMSAVPLRDVIVGSNRSTILLLFGAVALVLVIACVNTAQFLLARAAERRSEVAMRFALGASRARLVRQFMVEALVLAVVAAVTGLAQASWLMAGLRSMLAPQSPLTHAMEIDAAVVAFTAAVAIVTTLACGLVPALQCSRVLSLDRIDARTAGVIRARTRHALIGVQVAVSMVLLVGAGLLVRGILGLQQAPRGYVEEDVTVMRMRIAGSAAGPAIGVVYRQYLERISAVPHVAAAAVADAPLPGSAGVEFSIVGRADDAATLSQQRASWRIVSPGYFSVLRIPLLAGRSFAEGDAAGRPAVAIINQEFARRFWSDGNPIGHQIRSGAGPRASVATIVGVVGSVRPLLQTAPGPQIYMSYLQQSEPNITLLIRAEPGAVVATEAVKQAIWSVVPDQPVFDIRPMSAVVAQPMRTPRTIALLLGGFALLAIVISTMGVYTVVSYLTTRRTKEIALRRAIGASARDVFRLVGTETMRWTLVGLALGIAAAIAATTALRAVVLGAAQVDVATIAGLAVLYVAVSTVAVWLPAARALRADPAAVLRAE